MTTAPNQRWTDGAGRQWIARLNVGDAEKLRGAGLDVLDPKALGAIFADPFRVLELMATAHESQYLAANLSRDEFISAATETAEIANAAADALEVALIDFFRRLRRPALAAVIEAAAKAAKASEAAHLAKAQDPKLAAAMEALTNKSLAEFDAAIDRAATGGTFGESPA